MPIRFLKPWEAVATDAEADHVHIHPAHDDMEHLLDEEGDCNCGPTVQAIFRPDGSSAWMYNHHSLDGRERHEVEGVTAICPHCAKRIARWAAGIVGGIVALVMTWRRYGR